MHLLEQAAIAGALTPDVDRATSAAQALARRLDAVSLPTERGWVVGADAPASPWRARCAAWPSATRSTPPRCAAPRRAGWPSAREPLAATLRRRPRR